MIETEISLRPNVIQGQYLFCVHNLPVNTLKNEIGLDKVSQFLVKFEAIFANKQLFSLNSKCCLYH